MTTKYGVYKSLISFISSKNQNHEISKNQTNLSFSIDFINS